MPKITNNVIRLIIVVVLFKLLYIVAGIVFDKVLPSSIKTVHDKTPISVFQRNDSDWYRRIAENSYPVIHSKAELGKCNNFDNNKQSVWAFFPAYPMLLRGTALITRLPFDVVAFFWSLVLSFLVSWGFYMFVKDFMGDKKFAFFATILLLLWPFHFYFSMYYTEAMFLAASMWGFWSVRNKNWIVCSLSIIVLTLVRPNGLLVAFAMYVYYLEQTGIISRKGIRLKYINRAIVMKSLLFLIGPIVLALFCLYQYKMTGYWNAYMYAQEGWCRTFTFPFAVLFTQHEYSLYFNSLYALAAISFSIFLIGKFPLSMNLIIWIGLLLPLTYGSTISVPRFISVIFPLWIYAAYFLKTFPYRKLLWIALFGGHLVIFLFWYIANPLSY